MPKELAEHEPLPQECVYLWRWFEEIVPSDSSLSFSEIEAWSRLTHRELEPWEVKLLKDLDRIRREVMLSD